MILSMSVAGLPFTGADVPGFAGNPTPELFRKFYQLGAFYPFFRGHGHIDYHQREPYAQSSNVQNVIKASIRLRYSLIDYIYTTFYVAST